MARFTDDNTDGYTDQQLAELNKRFEARAAAVDMDDQNAKSTLDHIAERVLAEFDDEIAHVRPAFTSA